MNKTMQAAYLPGNSTTILKEVPIPEPGQTWEALWDLDGTIPS